MIELVVAAADFTELPSEAALPKTASLFHRLHPYPYLSSIDSGAAEGSISAILAVTIIFVFRMNIPPLMDDRYSCGYSRFHRDAVLSSAATEPKAASLLHRLHPYPYLSSINGGAAEGSISAASTVSTTVSVNHCHQLQSDLLPVLELLSFCL